VKVKNAIGSGDAFLAGYLYKIIGQASVKESLKFAYVLGALVAT
jgi:fructokinase